MQRAGVALEVATLQKVLRRHYWYRRPGRVLTLLADELVAQTAICDEQDRAFVEPLGRGAALPAPLMGRELLLDVHLSLADDGLLRVNAVDEFL